MLERLDPRLWRGFLLLAPDGRRTGGEGYSLLVAGVVVALVSGIPLILMGLAEGELGIAGVGGGGDQRLVTSSILLRSNGLDTNPSAPAASALSSNELDT